MCIRYVCYFCSVPCMCYRCHMRAFPFILYNNQASGYSQNANTTFSFQLNLGNARNVLVSDVVVCIEFESSCEYCDGVK